jgi:hypothetical protein
VKVCDERGEFVVTACPADRPSGYEEHCVECNPEAAIARQCQQDQPQICDESGSWVDGACVQCDPAVDALRCHDGNSESCAATGSRGLAEICTDDTPACNPTSGRCLTCEDGDRAFVVGAATAAITGATGHAGSEGSFIVHVH